MGQKERETAERDALVSSGSRLLRGPASLLGAGARERGGRGVGHERGARRRRGGLDRRVAPPLHGPDIVQALVERLERRK
eukprot:1091481-Rhodomonas_salina.1